jgi:hypothetical protein
MTFSCKKWKNVVAFAVNVFEKEYFTNKRPFLLPLRFRVIRLPVPQPLNLG